ncbi:hypothetical protein CCH79_00011992, partial [Gambusia affinis]
PLRSERPWLPQGGAAPEARPDQRWGPRSSPRLQMERSSQSWGRLNLHLKNTHIDKLDLNHHGAFLQQRGKRKVYFWTSSPSLPASEEGFQPMPSITIRPPDDQHLPTANTCISRLYVPLYSSKQILKQKLLLAIKTKNFGFV